MAIKLAAVIAVLALSACSSDYEEAAGVYPDGEGREEVSSSYYAGESEEAGTVQDEGGEEAAAASTGFMGYPCTVDCSGHEAGYQWAEDNGIDDPSDCGGNSNSFIEGCEAYAEEQSEEEY